jgi:effector-binding domain-containing protein
MTSYAVQVQQLESVPVAVIRRVARQSELSRVVPECCGLVWNALKAQQAKGGRHVAIYRAGDGPGSLRVEIGAELLGEFVESGDVVQSATPAGTVAWTTHLGPYGGLGGANEAIKQWVKANNRQIAGPSWEIYGHWLPEWNNDPSQIRTDVFWLLV